MFLYLAPLGSFCYPLIITFPIFLPQFFDRLHCLQCLQSSRCVFSEDKEHKRLRVRLASANMIELKYLLDSRLFQSLSQFLFLRSVLEGFEPKAFKYYQCYYAYYYVLCFVISCTINLAGRARDKQ